ncbi:rod shape-determining protein MreD [Megasphaera cerevisiae DSM 20462]|jgi:rod shape-determining protein MreD|uniref:Rod shape-determining protein MreD n=1 Tax=Megasphaera cerevisiae DSM 20462 TaxID=1122219 RepID=A0A0J6X126_9FIRM|nr:rod shape-determining protein MreD [Megasphaera cerevisiae]KMO87857.1 rod shape-determining protein MreD [Megasphaera cerevisiae DSM 20462]MCI1750139.1 rod shape-determining protein MreD [Megasphaera cerevisiae]OKY54355.1 rod shape-determining protein MreD [Megasphaera cerevisiae]SJZ42076.1 rod shape-determining protein MreD [Megasphaera cerevisiae DSM 20462]
MKKLSCLMAAFIAFILQSAVFPFIFNGISQPNLIFVFIVLVALHHGQRIGIIAALAGGFCQDVLIGNFFGIHLLPYLLIALICSYIGRNIDKDQWILTLLIVLGATESCLILTCIVLLMSGQFVNIASYLFEFSIPMLIYHGILALPVDHIVWKLRREDSYYGYREYRW